jgi:VTC domain
MTRPSLLELLAAFEPATPTLLATRALLRRTDSKFLASAEQIPELLAGLASAYAVIEVPGARVARYRSLYLDTPALRSYHDHRRGRRLRHKVRIRHYPDRGVAFLEIKSRRSDRITDKHRVEVPYRTGSAVPPAARAFLDRHCPYAEDLGPAMRVDYQRIGLISYDTDERVTIDLGVAFEDMQGARRTLDGLAIIEVKQPHTVKQTPITHALRAAGLRACSLSKYAAATALAGGVRCHRFRPTLRALQRLA